MTFLGILTKVAVAAPIGIAAITALPICGAAGTITVVGIAVGSIVGAVAGVADEILGQLR